MTVTKNDTIDKITFHLMSDDQIKDGQQGISIRIRKDIVIDKAGSKTFTTGSRRHNQTDLGEVVEGLFRTSREIFVKSGTDLEPYIDKAKTLIREHIERRQESFKLGLNGANSILENIDDSFQVSERYDD